MQWKVVYCRRESKLYSETNIYNLKLRTPSNVDFQIKILLFLSEMSPIFRYEIFNYKSIDGDLKEKAQI